MRNKKIASLAMLSLILIVATTACVRNNIKSDSSAEESEEKEIDVVITADDYTDTESEEVELSDIESEDDEKTTEKEVDKVELEIEKQDDSLPNSEVTQSEKPSADNTIYSNSNNSSSITGGSGENSNANTNPTPAPTPKPEPIPEPKPEPEPEKPQVITVTSLSVDQGEVILEVGGAIKVNAWASPDNATDKGLSWSSENEGVATVDGNGYIVAKAPGSTRIVVTSNSNGGVKAHVNVVVNEAPKPQPSFAGSSIMSQLQGEGWVSAHGGIIWDANGNIPAAEFVDLYMQSYEGSNGDLDIKLDVAGYEGDTSFNKAQSALSKIIPSGASTVIDTMKNGGTGSWTFDGRSVTLEFGYGCAVVKVYAKY